MVASGFSQTAQHQVQFEVDGTVKYANVTCTCGENLGKEQKTVKLPYRQDFFVKGGAFLYLSAQKARVTRPAPLGHGELEVVDNGVDGSVHVAIRVNGTVLQEAKASAPFGIATASGAAPD